MALTAHTDQTMSLTSGGWVSQINFSASLNEISTHRSSVHMCQTIKDAAEGWLDSCLVARRIWKLLLSCGYPQHLQQGRSFRDEPHDNTFLLLCDFLDPKWIQVVEAMTVVTEKNKQKKHTLIYYMCKFVLSFIFTWQATWSCSIYKW